ncbi:MAG TPA: Nudix family hydrolase [Devosia sp.]|nr:Nudix family hydrolase [Devosia sp.]
MSKPFIDVAAGLILRADGSLLLADRPEGKPWSGWWELPGGKIEAGESVMQALSRELKEELDIDITHASPWVTFTHEYPSNIVRLAFCKVTGWRGEPTGMEGQRLAWIDPLGPLTVGPVLPATEPPLRWLRLPDRYLITSIGDAHGLPSFLDMLTLALENGIKLVQYREPGWDDEQAFEEILLACRQYGARCLVNSCHPPSWWQKADGVHFRAADVRQYASDEGAIKHGNGLIGVSAHTPEDFAAARRLNADFVVLGHVLDTPSHPQTPGMGWDAFTALAQQAGLPVYAIGGQSADTLETAKQHGAHGIAGIRHIARARKA